MSIKIGNTAPKKVYIEGDEVKEVYIDSIKIRPTGWQPGANTLLYCPLDTDINDATGNHTMTAVTSSYGTVAKDSTGYYYFNGGYITSENYTGPKQATISVWIKKGTKHTSNGAGWCLSTHYRNGNPYHYFALNCGGNNSNGEYAIAIGSSGNYQSITQPTVGIWQLWTLTYSNGDNGKFYRNGVLESTKTLSGDLGQYNGPTNIGATFAFTDQFFEGYLSRVIYEDKVRTAQEISDYFNATKGNYGIS